MSRIAFSFLINKQANFYYFLHNLNKCEWPWPYRNSFLSEWEKMFGKLTREEKIALKEFNVIYSKYFLKKYLGKLFFLHKHPWKVAEEKLTKKEIDKFKKVFFIFNDKFEKLFNYLYLTEWQKKLKNYSKKQEKYLFIKISKKIASFFGPPFSHKIIKVFLIFSKNKKINNKISVIGLGGERGRGLDGRSIFLEFSLIPFNKINYVVGVIWHEICHSQFAGSHLNYFLKGKFKKNKKAASFIEEVIIRSLFPFGFLGVKLLSTSYPKSLNPSSEDRLLKISEKQTKKIIKITKNYLNKSKGADKDYLDSVIKILKEDKKWANLLG